jgi:ribosomal protein RSM22 (predicted rRNA methylase)
MPATHAAVLSALREAAQRSPEFHPRTLLDAGAGPGTASWAAAHVWPELEKETLIERDAGMIALGKRLAQHASAPLRSGEWLQADLAGEWQAGKHDVVVLSYALGELAEGMRSKLIRRLWESAESLLVIVEPGTKAGFDAVRQAREMLMSLGATTLAPCPHNRPCPMQGADWCHFSVRVARSRLHKLAMGAVMGYEDDKFSYIAVSKVAGATPCAARVLRHPQTRKGHVYLDLCTADGHKSIIISKRQGKEYQAAKDLKWGDAADCLFNE